jgi:UDP-2,3-diacylglucosamine pyrophosphatase LpxH
MLQYPHFDELNVISDLHMGGASGFQIFAEGARIEKWIRRLAQHSPGKLIGLLINGDLVDFLAEPNATYFDPFGAERKLARICDDPSFRGVWQALGEFVKNPRRRLIITIGNHDLELMLPWVRDSLLNQICKNDNAARRRVTLAFDGSGCRCRFGGATVYCVHGNDVDTWNYTSYEKVRRIVRDIFQGRTIEPWIPNAGSQLVIDVMNGIKTDYPFVDLLKPELEAVVPILYWLEPRLARKLDKILGVARRVTWDTIRQSMGLLAGKCERPAFRRAEHNGALLNAVLEATFDQSVARGGESHTVEELLRTAHERLLAEVEARDVASVRPDASDNQQLLGWWGASFKWLTRKPPNEVLRTLLDNLMTYQGFDFKHVDETFRRIDASVSSSFDFVVTGHTHQERAILRSKGGGFYYNSGTWVPLIRLTPDILSSETNFKAVYDAFRTRSMNALKSLKPPIMMTRPTVVSIRSEGTSVVGMLNHVEKNGEPDPLKGSEFVREWGDHRVSQRSRS